MIWAVITRTSTWPMRDRNDPSAKGRQTGSLRSFLTRTSRSAPVAASAVIQVAAAKLRSASTIIPARAGAQQIVGVAEFADPVGAEHGVDDGAGAAGDQGQHADQRVPGAAMRAAAACWNSAGSPGCPGSTGWCRRPRRPAGRARTRPLPGRRAAAGPRSRSNSARSGATPTRRRAWASAPALGTATGARPGREHPRPHLHRPDRRTTRPASSR